jgi:pentatricopeptide repeat protein
MAIPAPPLAKLTRPATRGNLARTRLFRQIDRNGKRGPLLWITGPPGCGKTTLASTYIEARNLPSVWYRVDEGDGDPAGFFYYLGIAGKRASPRTRKPLPLLTPEFLGGIEGFTRLFFEKLFARIPPGGVLVFDDYHELPAASPIHDAIAAGLSRAPEGKTVFFLSRHGPPPAFARFRVHQRLKVLGWDDLRLTLEECRGIVRLRGKKRIPDDVVRRLHAAADGWTAGLVLMLERGGLPGVEAERIPGRAPGELFEYFGSEIFARAERPVREFLVKTAFLPDMTAASAEALTGQRGARRLLSYLVRNNIFLTEHFHSESVYQYHPLFREFLLSRAADLLKEEEIGALKNRAAAMLSKAGRIEDAARLFGDTGDHESLAGLILAHAPSLLAQGRNRVLEAWLRGLPEQAVDRDPRLLFWYGKCRMPFDPAGSRSLLERSFERFLEREDAEGIFRSWSLIMDNLCMYLNDFKGLDAWIDRFDGIKARHPSFPSPEIEARAVASLLGGLYMRRVDHPDIVHWVDKALSVIPACGDIGIRLQGSLYLFLYFIWTGNFPKAQVLVESIRPLASKSASHPQARILFHLFETRLYCGTARFDLSLRAAEKGLAIARESGMHVWDFLLIGEGAAAALAKGDLDAASAYLNLLVPYLDGDQVMSKGYFHYLSSWRAALQGEYPLAVSFAERAIELADEMGAPCAVALTHAFVARLRMETGQVAEAERHLEAALAIAGGMWSMILVYQCRLVAADIAFAKGEDRRGYENLRDALGIGRERGYFHYENWLSPFMIRLCLRALEAGMETEYVREIIRKRNLVPDSPPVDIEAWPWPVRIRTFGRFEIERDGKPLVFSRKVQKRPLSLLKALIAFGGRAVREERIADTVWPDSEGDLAIQTMSVALRRLRQLLGHEKAVRRREGILELDPRVCWVDAFSFERLLGKASSQREAGWGDRAAELEEKALALYRGPFLAEESGRSWTVSLRERMRSRYLSTVGRLGADHLRAGKWDKAREIFRRGIEVDNLAEEFYQSLMRCYLAEGRTAEALAVYDRLEKTFSSLGVSPSPKTRDLLASLRTT